MDQTNPFSLGGRSHSAPEEARGWVLPSQERWQEQEHES